MKELPFKIGSFIVAAATVFVFAGYAVAQESFLGQFENKSEVRYRSRVFVSDVDQLYAAVNDPQNAGRQIVAAPGVYMLSANDSSGAARPNDGRLEFQVDMSLVGVVGDRSAVVINGINLPATSFPRGPVPLGAIRLGHGHNAVEWLTVQDTRNGHANIVTGLTSTETQYVRIAHVASSGSGYGISILNFGTAPSVDADLVDNDLFDGAVGMKGGFRIRNSSGAPGKTIKARLIGNRMWGNQLNIILNTAMTGGQIEVLSIGNSYFDNGNGLTIVGGLNSSDNTINFMGIGDSYTNNNAGSAFDRGGLVIVGGDKLTTTPLSNNNTVNATLVRCLFSGNDLWDLAAIGARSFLSSTGAPGVNNHVTLNIFGPIRGQGIVEFFADSVPPEYADTNSVRVNRFNTGWQLARF